MTIREAAIASNSLTRSSFKVLSSIPIKSIGNKLLANILRELDAFPFAGMLHYSGRTRFNVDAEEVINLELRLK